MSKTSRERLERVNDLGRPEGAYLVELRDADTRRLVERIEAPNYISPAYERAVRWFQGGHFHDGYQAIGNGKAGRIGGMGPVGTGSTYVDWLSPPRWNADAVVLTDSSIAENSASEWGTGRTIAYGTRYKLTIPASSRRGQINEAQSLLSNDVVRLVWDFVETQGNGTFQSINLADIDSNGNLVCPSTGYHYRYSNPGGIDLGLDLVLGGMNSAGTEAYGVAVEPSSGAGVAGDPVALYRVNLTGGTDNGDHYQCTTPTKLFTLAGVTYSNGTTAGSLTTIRIGTQCGVVNVGGGEYLISWPGDDGEHYLGRYNGTGAEVWKMAVIGPGDTIVNNPCTASGLAADATKAYIAPGYPYSDGEAVHYEIHRVDLATQTVDATYSLGDRRPYGCQLLGSDLLVGVGAVKSTVDLEVDIEDQEGLYRISTGGTHIEYLGNPYDSSRSELPVAPWSTSQAAYSASIRRERRHDRFSAQAGGDGYALELGGASSTSHADNELYSLRQILVGGGKVYACGEAYQADPGQRALYQLGGSNIYSRTVLGSPQAKSSSQTMQITYELTLPSSWRGRPSHVAPPS